MSRLVLVILVVLPVVFLLTFGLTRNPRELPSALIEQEAPDFDLETLGGERVTLSSLRGNPVVLNFWSTWCGPCLAEHRLVREASDLYGPRGTKFYSILYEDTVENVKTFLARHGEGAPILLDQKLKTAIDYGVSGVPETFFINGDGVVVRKRTGLLSGNLLNEGIGEIAGGRGLP